MEILDTLVGMPWNEFVDLWKISVDQLFTEFLFLTVVLYIMFVVVLAITESLDALSNYTIYFFAGLLLFADPIARGFAAVERFLNHMGINLPNFFA